jgi:hypothetical protein
MLEGDLSRYILKCLKSAFEKILRIAKYNPQKHNLRKITARGELWQLDYVMAVCVSQEQRT